MALSQEEIRVGPQGRVVIPAALRKALGLHDGDRLVAKVEDGRLVLEKWETIIARIQDAYAPLLPKGVSLTDELIAERREEARHEDAE